jgi:hypothetical protein
MFRYSRGNPMDSYTSEEITEIWERVLVHINEEKVTYSVTHDVLSSMSGEGIFTVKLVID